MSLLLFSSCVCCIFFQLLLFNRQRLVSVQTEVTYRLNSNDMTQALNQSHAISFRFKSRPASVVNRRDPSHCGFREIEPLPIPPAGRVLTKVPIDSPRCPQLLHLAPARRSSDCNGCLSPGRIFRKRNWELRRFWLWFGDCGHPHL